MSFGIRRGPPAIMHVTHYKAGSQWILAILQACVPDLVVQPEPGVAHFLNRRLEKGRVYPTLYVTREQFEAADLPRRWRRFVVIRDLRDALVSAYFSLRYSHATDNHPHVALLRDQLISMGKEEALLALARASLRSNVEIQRSWLRSGVEPIKFEQLLDHAQDIEVLERVLIDECDLPVPRERLRSVVEGARFHRMSGGRAPGDEDRLSHWRKGTAGDWRNHFTDPVKDLFKELCGDDLIAAGYERDHDW
jgi:lipopolysaccharide transport system ATP-binding protein